ncbi:type III-B CRISPR module-associated protein Cmr3 [Methanopyrus sp.]
MKHRHVAVGFLVLPQDRAFFRRPEPFRAAAESVAESEGPKPWTVAGCVRNALLKVASGELKNALEYPRKVVRSVPPGTLEKALEEGTSLFLGTWIVEVRPDTPDRIERAWWPRPAHLVKYEPENGDSEKTDLLRLEKVGNAALAFSGHDGTVRREYGFRTPEPPEPGSDVEPLGHYVDSEAIPEILAGRPPRDVEDRVARFEELLHPELHVGIKLRESKTVDEGHLYAAKFLRPSRSPEEGGHRVGFLTVLTVPEDAWEDDVLDAFPSPDGRLGRGRHAWVIPLRPEEWVPVAFPEVEDPGRGYRGLYLETPTPFPRGNLRFPSPGDRLEAEIATVRPGDPRDDVLPVELGTTGLSADVLADRVPATRRVSTWSGSRASPDHLAAAEGTVLALEGPETDPGTPLLLFPRTEGEGGDLLTSRLAFHLSGVGTAYALRIRGNDA